MRRVLSAWPVTTFLPSGEIDTLPKVSGASQVRSSLPVDRSKMERILSPLWPSNCLPSGVNHASTTGSSRSWLPVATSQIRTVPVSPPPR